VSTRRAAIACALVGAAYAAVLTVRGDPAPGIVGGVLLAVLVFLIVRRVQEYNAHKRREAARRRGGADA
jgi:hypothetical protein